MKRNHTSKLYYGKYPYKIVLARSAKLGDPDFNSGWTVYNAEKFLTNNCIDHRMYNQVFHTGKKETLVTTNSSLFLCTQADFDRCMGEWPAYVQSVTVPFKEEHVDILKDRTEIIVRSSLVYKRFKYIVVFKREYRDDMVDVTNWINDSFNLYPSKTATARWSNTSWWPRLYLTNESDLMLTKLTYGERIKGITVVCTFDELEQNPSKP